MKIQIIADEKHKLTLDLPINDAQELKEKVSSFKTLCHSLKHEDLVMTTEMIKEKPLLIPTIKEIMEESKNKTKFQITTSALGWINRILSVIKG